MKGKARFHCKLSNNNNGAPRGKRPRRGGGGGAASGTHRRRRRPPMSALAGLVKATLAGPEYATRRFGSYRFSHHPVDAVELVRIIPPWLFCPTTTHHCSYADHAIFVGLVSRFITGPEHSLSSSSADSAKAVVPFIVIPSTLLRINLDSQ